MPPRSVKMKRFIFGSQRRVWWPKWTPASSSSRMLTTDMFPLRFRLQHGRRARVEPAFRRERHRHRHPSFPPGRVQERSILASDRRSAPDSGQMGLQFGRQWRLGLDPFLSERMREGQPRCVQELASERGLRAAVDSVADDGKVDRGQVDPDLVCPTGLEPDSKERVTSQKLLDLEMRRRLTRLVRVERMALWVGPVAPDRCLDPPAPRARPSPDERDVHSLELSPPDEISQTAVRLR